MAQTLADMIDLDERDYAVLRVLVDGRVNPYLIREQTDLDKGDINTVLVRLGRTEYIQQVTRRLYEITEKGDLLSTVSDCYSIIKSVSCTVEKSNQIK